MTTRSLRSLEKKRAQLLEELLTVHLMVKGVFGTTFRRCGKKGCWCAANRGHPYRRITWSEESRSRTKAISEEDADWTKEMTANYKRFRESRQKLGELELEFKAVLARREQTILEKTKKARGY